jgi:nucleoside-diphosphate-sugar epimerase
VCLLSRHQDCFVEEAKREFGFAPTLSLEEGFSRTVEWLRWQPASIGLKVR